MANKQKTGKRIIALFLTACLCSTMLTPVSFADSDEALDDLVESVEEQTSSSLNESLMATGNRDSIYSNYLDRHSDAAKPMEEVVIEGKDYVSTAPDADSGEEPQLITKSYEGVEDCLAWTNQQGEITYKFNVATTGLYNLEMLYYPISGANTVIEMGLLIDGEYPFTAAKTFTLDRYWKDKNAISKDSKDNELRPAQVEYDCWVTYPIKDKEGLYNDPYFFYLEAGEHEMTLVGIKTNFVLKSLTFKNYKAPVSYDSIKPTQDQLDSTPALTGENDVGSSTIFIQGENAKYKTASTLYATYDRTSCMTNPSHPTKQRYNTVGADTWKKSTQALIYEVSVPADGYYRISLKVRQNKMRGFFSNRRVYIDGEVPCEELSCVQFPYSPNWYSQTLKDNNGEDLYLYLTAGKHELRLEAVPGSIGEVMKRLDDLIFTLNYYYRRILMITGPSPDEFTDYFVDKQIPELIPTFEYIIERLYAEKDGIEALTKKGSEASALEAMAIILQRCCDKKDEIPSMKNSIKDSISSVSAWMRDYRDQPLELDYIEIATVHETFAPASANFFEDLAFGFQSFIGSFFEDYTVMSEGSAKSLNVWVSLGRDQATVVKELVDSDFNVNYDGIEASINLVQGSILEATLAGKGPEIALFIGGDFPIQLAARDLLVDLTQFKDYEAIVKERFTPNLTTLFKYRGGVYGLPVSQSFPMMFYRTDILDELGEKPPETWDDLVDLINVLQRTYLSVGLLSPTSNLSNSIFDAGDTFAMLMLQTGQGIYNSDLTATTFNTEPSVDAFTKWTKFYTVYSLDQTYDAFSRFRTGEMPIVIQNYTFFNQLTVSAPEIKGLWDFTLVPGTVQEDGSVSHAANSGSAGAIIFEKVSDQQAAWTFVKWFTSDEVQVEYGKTIEALMGQMGRFDTANMNALSELPWSTAEYNKISAQMAQTVEIPVIPASYATTRHVKNAFRAVVNDTWNTRYALSAYNRDINAEIERKNSELESFD